MSKESVEAYWRKKAPLCIELARKACEQHGVDPDEYDYTVFRETLHDVAYGHSRSWAGACDDNAELLAECIKEAEQHSGGK